MIVNPRRCSPRGAVGECEIKLGPYMLLQAAPGRKLKAEEARLEGSPGRENGQLRAAQAALDEEAGG